MAMDRVLFIPWNRSQAGTFATEHDQADIDGSHHKRKWKSVCLDDPGKPLAEVGFGTSARIHVVGHGAIGDPTIDPDHGVTGASPVHADDIATMMIAKGLKKYYIGTVACDVCYSALGEPSFAKTLARALWKNGIKASCVLGYEGPLYSTYYDFTSHKGRESKYGHRSVIKHEGTSKEKEVKSKYAQTRFVGWT